MCIVLLLFPIAIITSTNIHLYYDVRHINCVYCCYCFYLLFHVFLFIIINVYYYYLFILLYIFINNAAFKVRYISLNLLYLL